MTTTEIRTFLASLLGPRPMELFDVYLDDFFCCIKSWAMTDLKSPSSEVRARLENVLRGIIAEAIKSYLRENHAEFNISNDHVFDRDMKEIPAILQIRTHQARILACLMEQAMSDFEKGRQLAIIVVDRANKYVAIPSAKVQQTPIESYEIEIMRLEQRLPNLATDEAKRLSELYALLKETQCAGK